MVSNGQKRAAFITKMRSEVKPKDISDAVFIKYEGLVRNKISNRYSNIQLEMNKLSRDFDPQRKGSVSDLDFSKLLRMFLVGYDEGEIAGMARLYSKRTKAPGKGGAVAHLVDLKAFMLRMLDADVGMIEREEEEEGGGGEGEGAENEMGKVNGKDDSEVTPMSQIPRTGGLEQRLAKFRTGIKGFFASKVSRGWGACVVQACVCSLDHANPSLPSPGIETASEAPTSEANDRSQFFNQLGLDRGDIKEEHHGSIR